MTLDWNPVVRSLLQHLRTQDILPFSVYDGAYRTKLDGTDEDERQEQAVDLATGQDECRISCRWWNDDTRSELVANFVLVLGNDPDELVADYFISSDAQELDARVSAALEAFGEEWAGKPCPTQAEAA